MRRDPSRLARRTLRAGIALALCAAASACTPPPDPTYLPDTTRRINASAERAAQLRTGAYQDDIPELTGAPGPDGRHPAYVPSRGLLAFRDTDVVTVPPEDLYEVQTGQDPVVRPVVRPVTPPNG